MRPHTRRRTPSRHPHPRSEPGALPPDADARATALSSSLICFSLVDALAAETLRRREAGEGHAKRAVVLRAGKIQQETLRRARRLPQPGKLLFPLDRQFRFMAHFFHPFRLRMKSARFRGLLRQIVGTAPVGMDALHDPLEANPGLPGKGFRRGRTGSTHRYSRRVRALPCPAIWRRNSSHGMLSRIRSPDLPLCAQLRSYGHPFFGVVERKFKGPCRRDRERFADNIGKLH